ncbi:hypothetical protein AB1N83_005780 [Pleurotus pulmonarius]
MDSSLAFDEPPFAMATIMNVPLLISIWHIAKLFLFSTVYSIFRPNHVAHSAPLPSSLSWRLPEHTIVDGYLARHPFSLSATPSSQTPINQHRSTNNNV